MKNTIKIIMICMVAVLMTGCFGKKEGEKKEVTNNPQVDESGKYEIADIEKDGVKISNIDISYIAGETVITGEVTNTSKKDITLSILKLIAIDKDGKEIGVLTAYIGDKLTSDANVTLNTSISEDLSQTTKLKLEVVK